MSKVIYKYPVHPYSPPLPLHRDYRILHVAVQGGQPCVWVLQDTSQPTVNVAIKAFATGQTIGDDELAAFYYIGTAVGVEDWMVFHFFSEGNF